MTLPEDDLVMQVCFVTADLDASVAWFSRMSGKPAPKVASISSADGPNAVYRGQAAGVDCRLAFFRLDNIDIEFVEPGPGPSAWREVLEAKGPGFHHLAFKTRDMKKRSAWLTTQGAPLVQSGEFASRTGRYAYHEMPAFGAMVELLEFDADRD
jgi:catechol 2,3-dioxygenase-like lactoylglutathione lyase family enzyme